MNIPRLSLVRHARQITMMIAAASFIAISFFAGATFAQQSQLTLADFLIGLRSKKVTLIERNKILAEAARTRGVTFALTPEIAKELQNTGADDALIAAIRDKGTIVKASAVVPKIEPKTEPVPVSTPPPPDHAFYQKQGLNYAAKGEMDLAIAEFTKAIEKDPTDAADYAGRGRAYYAKRSFQLAVADFNKAIELKPKDSMAYLGRGFAVEKLGHSEKALEDYQKSIELDPTNESAKLNVKRLQDELAKAKAIEEAAKPAPPPAKPVIPEFVNLGALTADDAIRMVNPTYPELARKSGVRGKVTIEVELDAEGNVADAKAVSGSSFLRQSALDAAKKSKFKPATINGQAIKSKASITYNFSNAGNE